MKGCNCALESRQSLPSKAESALMSSHGFEFEVREITLLSLPEETLQITEPSPVWHDFGEFLKDQEFVAFPAFPNPPPSAS